MLELVVLGHAKIYRGVRVGNLIRMHVNEFIERLLVVVNFQ